MYMVVVTDSPSIRDGQGLGEGRVSAVAVVCVSVGAVLCVVSGVVLV